MEHAESCSANADKAENMHFFEGTEVCEVLQCLGGSTINFSIRQLPLNADLLGWISFY